MRNLGKSSMMMRVLWMMQKAILRLERVCEIRMGPASYARLEAEAKQLMGVDAAGLVSFHGIPVTIDDCIPEGAIYVVITASRGHA